jgi:uncharacterized damage-inducible protein DinB
MSDKATKLAEKLTSEGERTMAFFQALPAEAWAKQIYSEGAMWTTRDVLEHLATSEHGMKRLCEQIIETGKGAPEDFDIDAFNKSRTGRFAHLTLDELHQLYKDTRARTVAYARTLDDAQLEKRGRHPAMGDSSVEGILKIIYLHNNMHIGDIKKSLA